MCWNNWNNWNRCSNACWQPCCAPCPPQPCVCPTQLPQPTVTSGTFNCSTTPTITGTGTPGATIHLTAGGMSYTTFVGSNGIWALPITMPLTAGAVNTLRVWQTKSGFTNSAVTSVALTVASPTTVALTAPTGTIPVGAASAVGTATPNSNITLQLDGGTTYTGTANALGNFIIPITVAAGAHTLTAVATTAQGCVSPQATTTFTAA